MTDRKITRSHDPMTDRKLATINWLGRRDSNPNKQSQSLLSYR